MPNVWDLFTDERIRLVYLLQRDAHKKASEEFQRVTEEYVKVDLVFKRFRKKCERPSG